MSLLRITVCTLLLTLTPAVAWSVDLVPSKDNSIFQNSSTVSGGGMIGIFVGANNSAQNPARRGLIQFDVAGGLPSGVTITGASLTLTLEMANNATSRQISLFRLRAEWGEGVAGAGQLGGSGFTAADGDATWTEAKHNQVNWTAGGDIAASSSASLAVAGNSAGTAYTWSSPGLLSDVQNWYANPASNFGWALVNADEATQQSVKVFYSREFATNAAFLPKLSITYVPEPTGIFLTAIASLAFLLRRGRQN
jgi:hypothetical protein